MALLIVRQRRDPFAAVAWVLLVAALPLVGTLLYILAGYRPAAVSNPCPDGTETAALPAAVPQQLAALIRRNCGSRVTCCNRITLLHNGSNAFSALIASLQHAVRSIDMAYYIFRDDRIGRTVAAILMRRARAGVRVRVIYDAVGSWRLGRGLIRRMRQAGIEIRPFEPVAFPWFTPCVTRRNHRKILITDGCAAYLGGINIAKYYLDGGDMGRWRDEHLRIEGEAVAELQRIFDRDWVRVGGTASGEAPRPCRRNTGGCVPVQIASAEAGASRRTLLEAFAAALLLARREVRISSPYFIPPPLLLDAIRMAAGSGVRVQILMPASSDAPLTDLVAESYIGELLDAGAEVYRYEAGFLHAKVLIVDDRIASVGTANMDYRSLLDNFEVTAFIYSRAEVRALAESFAGDLQASRRVMPDAWRQRPWRRRCAGDFARLLAPLM